MQWLKRLFGGSTQAQPAESQSSGSTDALFSAIDRGDVRAVRRLLDAGLAVDSVGQNGRTALHQAAKCGYPEIVGLLLDRGASVRALTSDGETPLNMAVSFDWCARLDPAVVELLIDHGADVEKRDHHNGWTPLYACTLHDNGADVASVILRKGAKVDGKTKFGDTPLFRAVIQTNIEMAALLIEHGANKGIRSGSTGQTPLEYVKEQIKGPVYAGDWFEPEVQHAFLQLLEAE
jgi:serine/threonine-protein phosphatase 6 regulatory ankyrin repeat subunit B